MYNIVEYLMYEYHWQKKPKEGIPRRVMSVVVVEGWLERKGSIIQYGTIDPHPVTEVVQKPQS